MQEPPKPISTIDELATFLNEIGSRRALESGRDPLGSGLSVCFTLATGLPFLRPRIPFDIPFFMSGVHLVERGLLFDGQRTGEVDALYQRAKAIKEGGRQPALADG